MKLISLFLIFFVILVTSNVAESGSRIIGGELAQPRQFPFSAALQIRYTTFSAFCTGSLINDQWILTSAQCLYTALSVNATLGSTLLNGNDPNKYTGVSNELFAHPLYDQFRLLNDIGLVKLPTVIAFNDYISPIVLPNINFLDYLQTTALGWGQKDDQIGLSNELRFVSVDVISNVECRSVFGSQIVDQMVCVRGNQAQGPCNYDTGSALVTYLADVPYVNAVQSFISGSGCYAGHPAGYTRVLSYLSWINTTIATFA